jgi:hypothetical protein
VLPVFTAVLTIGFASSLSGAVFLASVTSALSVDGVPASGLAFFSSFITGVLSSGFLGSARPPATALEAGVFDSPFAARADWLFTFR